MNIAETRRTTRHNSPLKEATSHCWNIRVNCLPFTVKLTRWEPATEEQTPAISPGLLNNGKEIQCFFRDADEESLRLPNTIRRKLVRYGSKTRSAAVPLLKTLHILYSPIIRRAALVLSGMDETQAIRIAQTIVPKALLPLRSQRARNLKRVFGPLGYTQEQYSRLKLEHSRYQGLVCAEIARLITLSPEELSKRVSLKGEEHLQSALREKKGVLLVGSHMGNFTHVAPILASHGYQISAVAERIPGMVELFLRTAKRFNINLAFIGDRSMTAAQSTFQRNEIFFLLFDVSLRRGHTVWLPLGHTTIPVDRGSAVLALRNRVPILRVSCQKVSHDHECITIAPEPSPPPMTNLHADTENLLRRWLALLYQEILQRPEQWWQWSFVPLGKGGTPQ
jgi:lauroyl/myristoyl acyltransferase